MIGRLSGGEPNEAGVAGRVPVELYCRERTNLRKSGGQLQSVERR